MALQKTKELPSGVSGNYWKIIETKIDRLRGKVSLSIALFKDKAASDANKAHLGVVHRFSGSINREQEAGDIVEHCYTLIKAQANQTPTPILNRMACLDLKDSVDV